MIFNAHSIKIRYNILLSDNHIIAVDIIVVLHNNLQLNNS